MFYWLYKNKIAGSPYPTLEDLILYKNEFDFSIVIPLQKRNDIEQIKDIGYQVFPMYIDDFKAPTIEQISEFITITKTYASKKILIHCTGGMGRTGTMLAAYEIYNNKTDTATAIQMVRNLKKGAIETKSQITVLKEYYSLLYSKI